MKAVKATSVIRLTEQLKKAARDQRFRYQWLVVQCGTQGLLARTKKPELGIVPMSLNTFKNYADSYIEGGFKFLDELRLTVLKQSEKPKSYGDFWCMEAG